MMKKKNLRRLSAGALTLFGLVVMLAWGSRQQVRSAARLTVVSRNAASQAKMKEVAGKLPLYFIENRGQTDARVGYYVQGRDATLYLTPQGVTLALTDKSARGRQVVKLDFVDANPDAKPTGQDLTPAVVSYFKGTQAQWKTGLKTYARVV